MRIKHIDILRGIAAMMVAIFHLARSSDVSHTSFDYSYYGWVGVQIFFVISGFILPYSLHKTGYQTKDFSVFILKRAIRIYPAYVAAIIIGVVLTYVTGREQIPGIAIASHLLFLNDIVGLPSGSAVFWTLAIEFQFYLLIGLLYSLFLTSNIKSVFLVFALTFASYFVTQASFIFYWMPFFGIGILIFNKKFTNMPNWLFWLSVCALLIIAFVKHGLPHTLAASFAVLFILYGNFTKETAIHKLFIFLGTISYSLYLIHWDLGRAAVRLTRHLPFINNVGVLRVVIGVLFSILCAWLLYISIERSSAKLSGKIKYKSKF
jgi:peptidoglycan/LPS O-acetylase OafA/YrhL